MNALRSFLFGLVLSGLAVGPTLGSGDCSDAIDLSGQPLPITVNGTTVGATNDYGPFPSCPDAWQFGWNPTSCLGPDVTYKWTVPESGRYTISLFGSNYNTCLLLYNYTCPNEPTYPDDLILGNDNAVEIPQSELYGVPLEAGRQVLIVVDGWGNSAGPFQLSVSRYQPVRSPAELDAFIESTMQAHHIPGLSAVATWGSDVVWSGSYGHADVSQGTPAADSTLFLLASISKTFVGVALMQLWEQGLFSLDDDVNLYLPWPVRNPSYPEAAITFRMLMTHTSSIRDAALDGLVTHGADSPIALDEFLYNYLTPGGLYYGALNWDPVSPPGTRCWYSNVGAALAGYLVERIDPAGRSLEDYCQQALFGPLGMHETSWFLANLDQSHIAVPYHWNGSGYTALPHDGFPYYPAGQLRTSSDQLGRFLLALQGHGQVDGTRILNEATVDSIFTIRSKQPAGFESYGLFSTNFHFAGRSLWGHPGGWHGYRTSMYFCPEENTGAVVLTNGEGDYGQFLVANELLEVGGTVNVPDAPLATARLELYPNYPNPFDRSTTISFSLAAPSKVRIGVYDVGGRQVASLAEGARDAGRHVVTWDGANVPSGIYYVRLDAGGMKAVRRLVRIR